MDASSFLKRGIEYFEKGDYDSAITDTSESIKLNPNDAMAYGTRGAAYKGKKDFDNAVADFDEAIRLDPNNAPAYGNRGLTYFAKGDKDQAILDLEMAVKLDPQNSGYCKILNELKGKKRGLWQAIKVVYSTCWRGMSMLGSAGFIIKFAFVVTPFVHLICLGLAIIVCIVWAIKR